MPIRHHLSSPDIDVIQAPDTETRQARGLAEDAAGMNGVADRTLDLGTRHKFVLAGTVLAIAAAAWTASLYSTSTGMSFGIAGFVALWTLMMAAMMLPSAIPATMLFATVAQSRSRFAFGAAPTASFVSGYLAAWALAGLGVALLRGTGLPEAQAWGQPVAGLAMVSAGAYQLTRWKAICLGHCRAPLFFFMEHWRDGVRGGVVMGLHHGVYCIGCCWGLMLALVVLGVMNPMWMVLVAMLISAEKVAPRGERLALLIGIALIVAGAAVSLGLVSVQRTMGGMI